MSIVRAFQRLLAFTACTVLFSSCFLFGPGSYEIDVTADGAHDMDALYVIVTEESKLPSIDGPQSYEQAIHPGRHRDYEAVLQFKPFPPSGGRGWAWAPRHDDLESQFVSYATDGDRLRVTIDKEALEVRTGLVVGFVTLHLSDGYDWKQIGTNQLTAGDGAKYLLRENGLQLTGY